MQKAFILGFGLMAASALPALADGYENAPPPNPGPDPLAPHEREYHHERDARVVYEPEVTYTSSSCCCCAPVTYGRTYVTEPVTIRRYTRTYTRLAPPDCYRTYEHEHDHHRGHRESYYEDYDSDVRYYSSSQSYSGRPVYRENSVIWAREGYDTYDEASYGGAWHNDRAAPWAHYYSGWRN